ncbi:hypothetical protein [Trinickia fusca]|uniref:Uncharacterized protein n=1 Tax=Trinickia fusca TaxID=2419777 RepID=A0A494XLB5_9BURK|nr:hypothetical protein [Trinickia fusca]RKP50531.1 hypothetical protein D7S89_05340 [Trinickia fusca]
MTEAEALLEVWRGRLALISSNLNELASSESTKRVRIRARQNEYKGRTKEQADRAIELMRALSDDYLLLANAVNDANEALRGGFFVNREARLERVSALLGSGAISRATGAVPIANRALLGSAQHADRLSADELLALMESEFASARDALHAIDQAEQQNKMAIEALRRDYERLDTVAASLGVTSDRPSFIELQDLGQDPLAATAGIEAMRRALETWAALIGKTTQAKEGATTGIARAGATLGELRGMSARYETERAKVESLLGTEAAATVPPLPADTVGMLTRWFETLRSSLEQGHWTAVNVGLAHLEAALEEATAAAEKALVGARGKCDELDDLRGRFSALKAKETAIAAQSQHQLGTEAIKAEIATALSARPVDVPMAVERLRQYQMLLSGQLQ